MRTARTTARRSFVAFIVVLVLFVVAACSGDSSAESAEPAAATPTDLPSQPTAAQPVAAEGEVVAVVDEAGVTLQWNDLTFSAPAGVAPAGTELVVREIETPDDVAAAGMDLATPGFDIVLSDGSQPRQPVTVSLDVGSAEQERDTAALAFITRNSETEQWEGLPVQVQDGVAMVELTHFSWGFWGWAEDLVDDFLDGASQGLGLSYPAPDCVDNTVTHAGREYSAVTDNFAMHVCVEKYGEGTVALTLHSNGPLVWLADIDTGTATGRAGPVPLNVAQTVTVSVYNATRGGDLSSQTILVPSGTATIVLNDDAEGTAVAAEVNDKFFILAATLEGAGALGALPHDRLIGIGDCLGGALESLASMNPIQIGRATLACIAEFATGPVGVALAVLSSVFPVVAAGLTRLFAGILDQTEAEISVTSSPLRDDFDWYNGAYQMGLFPGDDPNEIIEFRDRIFTPSYITHVAIDPADDQRAAVVAVSSDSEGFAVNAMIGVYSVDGEGVARPEVPVYHFMSSLEVPVHPSVVYPCGQFSWDGGDDDLTLTFPNCPENSGPAEVNWSQGAAELTLVAP